ncbi:MAG: PfaD family polyunsaturated fatty acid/polyketide biosynthesis protein [Anaerolineae bacterium]
MGWEGPAASIAYDPEGALARLRRLNAPCHIVANGQGLGVTNEGTLSPGAAQGPRVVLTAPPLSTGSLGDRAFLETYGVDRAYMAGSMANAISGEELVIALGRQGLLGAFGSGGLAPGRLETAIRRIQAALPDGPYAFNLIHNPHEPVLEHEAVRLYLSHGVRVVEASAYLSLTPHVVHYRVAGLSRRADGRIEIGNRVIAKLSRREVAAQFMQPAPEKLLRPLVEQGLITREQAALAEHVPMADDITVEADSGGHTDNRPLVCLLPSILAQRDEVQAARQYGTPVRVGAAGGIGTPAAALGAFMMGAAYVVTGSVNHSSVEAGTSEHVKGLLAQADMADVMMAPAADMFELGVNLQVLKRGTMFPLRARKLYELYQSHDALDEIPASELRKLEVQVFKQPVSEVWKACEAFFGERDPQQLVRASENPKRKMALVFRWYLGLATRWGIRGEPGRELDYQIWCGPAMGAFNDWVRGTYLEDPAERHVAHVARQIMDGAAFLYRLQSLRMQGLRFPATFCRWIPARGSQVVDASVS